MVLISTNKTKESIKAEIDGYEKMLKEMPDLTEFDRMRRDAVKRAIEQLEQRLARIP